MSLVLSQVFVVSAGLFLGGVPAPYAGLMSKDKHVRLETARSIAAMAQKAQDAVPFLIRQLDVEPESDNRIEILEALVAVAPKDKVVHRRLVDAIGDKSLAKAALHHLRGIGDPAVPAMARGLESSNALVRSEVARLLGFYGFNVDSVIPALRKALSDSSAGVKLHASWAFVHLGPKGECAIPDLARLVREDDEARTNARQALGAIGKTAIPTLLRLLEDENVDVRVSAAMAFEKMGPEGYVALPKLQQALQDSNSDVRRWAAEAIKSIKRRP